MLTLASAVDFETALLRTLREDAGLSALVGNKVFPLAIPAGNYLLKLTKDGYDTVWKTISLKPGEKRNLDFSLEQETASPCRRAVRGSARI